MTYVVSQREVLLMTPAMWVLVEPEVPICSLTEWRWLPSSVLISAHAWSCLGSAGIMFCKLALLHGIARPCHTLGC